MIESRSTPLWCQSFTVGLGLLSRADLLAMIAKPLVLSTLKTQGIIALPIQESMPSVSGVLITRKGEVLTRSAQQFFDCMKIATRKYLANAPDCFLPNVAKDDRRAVHR